MSLFSALKSAGSTGFGYGSTAEEVTRELDLSGNAYLITGCNSGLGLETARVLARRGGRIIGAARSMKKARNALDEVAPGGIPVACDLAQPESVEACVDRVAGLGFPLDAIVANAGIMALPALHQVHGIELQFLVNHVGHFILVNGLLERLSPSGRVVVVSSRAHRRAPRAGIRFDDLSGEQGYSPWAAYGQSKLANLLFARALARRLPGADQTANAVHPGVIATNLGRHLNPLARMAITLLGPLFFKSIPQGAATQCYVAVHPDAAGISGEYWSDCNVAEPSERAKDEALAERLWEETERIVARLTGGPLSNSR